MFEDEAHIHFFRLAEHMLEMLQIVLLKGIQKRSCDSHCAEVEAVTSTTLSREVIVHLVSVSD